MRSGEILEPANVHSGKVSYYLMGIFLVLVGLLHLGGPLLVALFSFLALHLMQYKRVRGRWITVCAFVVLVAAISYGLGFLVRNSVKALPEIADKAIPSVIQLAKRYNVELPFTDYDSLKDAALEGVKGQVQYLGSFARAARGVTKQVVLSIVGAVVAVSIFLHPHFELTRPNRPPSGNLYSAICDSLAARFRSFYKSFELVMGAQVVISLINTLLTGIFFITSGLPHLPVVLGLTFLCGLLPVVGNLISNTIIVGIGLTISPTMALVALIFLVVIHKLEYFLNSKIIGHRIKNPLWLLLIGLVAGEKLMGVPGMILAPVFLHYLKTEVSAFRSGQSTTKPNPSELLVT